MDYIVYSHNDSFIYVSKINGNQIILKKDIPQDSKIFKTASLAGIRTLYRIKIWNAIISYFTNFVTIINVNTLNICRVKHWQYDNYCIWPLFARLILYMIQKNSPA